MNDLPQSIICVQLLCPLSHRTSYCASYISLCLSAIMGKSRGGGLNHEHGFAINFRALTQFEPNLELAKYTMRVRGELELVRYRTTNKNYSNSWTYRSRDHVKTRLNNSQAQDKKRYQIVCTRVDCIAKLVDMSQTVNLTEGNWRFLQLFANQI